MITKILRVGESTTADGAMVGVDPLVHADVSFESEQAAQLLPTDNTHELIACMSRRELFCLKGTINIVSCQFKSITVKFL